MLNNPKLAQLYVESLAKKIAKGELDGYNEGNIPAIIAPWSKWIKSHA